MPRATVYRMLNFLVAEEYLVRMPDLKGFALGVRVAELTGGALRRPQQYLDTQASLLPVPPTWPEQPRTIAPPERSSYDRHHRADHRGPAPARAPQRRGG